MTQSRDATPPMKRGWRRLLGSSARLARSRVPARHAAAVLLAALAGTACAATSAWMGPDALLGAGLMRAAPQNSGDALFGRDDGSLALGAPRLTPSAPQRPRAPAAIAPPPFSPATPPRQAATRPAPTPPLAVRLPRADPDDPPTPPPLPDSVPPGADRACLRELRRARVPYVTVGPVRGVKTPVQIIARLRGVELMPRAGRPAVMDCELARTLVELAPLFRELGITALSFSGAYDYRTRRGSHQLSAHAHGLAIDVHALETKVGPLDVAKDYPRNRLRWRTVDGAPRTVETCLGSPVRPGARVLRTLACELKLHPSIRVILTPDDNADHRDHLHIETHPARQPQKLYSHARRAGGVQ